MRQLIHLSAGVWLISSVSVIVRAQKPESIVQTGHSDYVTSVAISPDGKILASGSKDKTIRLWEIATGRELRTLTGHRYDVESVIFSSDGKTLASAGSDGTIRLWDIHDGVQLHVLSGHGNHPGSLGITSDGQILVSGSTDTIKVWNVKTATALQTLSRHSDNATSIAITSNGRILASVDGPGDKTINLSEVSSGVIVKSLTGHSAPINSLVFNSDGTILASGGEDNTVRVWDVKTGTPLFTITDHTEGVKSVTFSPDGKILVSKGGDATLRFWDANTGRQLRTIITEQFGGSLAFTPDGMTLATSGQYDETIDLWNVSTGTRRRTLNGSSSNVLSVALDFHGRFLASGSSDGLVRLWDLHSDAPPRTLASDLVVSETVTSMPGVEAIAFSNDGKTLASGGTDKGIKLWNVSAGKRTGTLTGDSVWPLAFAPDGQYLAGVESNTIKLWDLSTGKLHTTFEEEGLRDQINSIAFSLDGKTLLSGSNDGYTRIWDVATGKLTRRFGLQSNSQMTRIFLSPDGKTEAISNYLVVPFRSSPEHGTIDLFETVDGSQKRVLTGLGGLAASLAFSPDGKLVAGGDSEGKIILWNRPSGEHRHTLSGHFNGISSLAFSGDSKVVVSGSEDGTTKLWDASTGRELVTLLAFGKADWLVVSPDGLFDGSPAAWKQIIYRFNKSTLDYAPVEAFYNEFYYPGLLADMFADKHPKAPSDISQKDRRQPQLKLTVGAAGSNATLTTRNLKVKLDISESAADKDHKTGSGAQDVRLFRNGSLVKVWRGDVLKEQSSVTLEDTIPIVAGENRLTAYAFNHDNIKSSDATLAVTGADSLRRKGTLRILAVGVSQYANREYNLNYTTDDATSFASQLKLEQERLAKFQPVEVKTLLNESATKANILAELKKLAAVAQPEDAVVVYFSGHGKASGDHFYLVPHDLGYNGSRDQLSSEGLKTILAHSISDQELEEAFRDIDAGQMFMIIDACNSGQALENKDEPRRGPMNTRGLAQLAYEKGMYIMTASQNVEEAFVSERLKHSYLTYALVEEGLKTKVADADHNGEVTLREWFDYALARVPKLREETLQSKSLEEVNPTMKAAARNQKSQTPRVFYRREAETQPLIIARP